MQKIILFLTCATAMPIIYGSAFVETSSDRSADDHTFLIESPTPTVRSLQDQTLQTLISHPDLLAQQYQQFASLYPYQQQLLFAESVHRALRTRLGWQALIGNPAVPLTAYLLEEERNPVFSPDGNTMTLISRNADTRQDQVHLRTADRGELINTFAYAGSKTFSPKGTKFLTFTMNSSTGQLELHMHDAATGNLLRIFEDEWYPQFSPDDRLFASCALSADQIPNYDDTQIHNLTTGNIIAKFEGEQARGFSPDGTIFVSAAALDQNTCRFTEIRLYNLVTGQRMGIYKGEQDPVFSPDGSILALTAQHEADKFSVYLRNPQTGELTDRFKNERNPVFSPDGRFLVSRTSDRHNNEIYVRSVETKELIATFTGKNPIISPDSQTIVFIAFNHQTSRYDLHVHKTTGELIGIFEGEENPSFTKDGAILALHARNTDTNQYEVRLRKTTSGDLIGIIKNERNPIFSPDGIMLATQTDEGTQVGEVDFRPDMTAVEDMDERILLLNAAHAWLANQAYSVNADNTAYQSLITRIAYLNNPALFDVQPSLSADMRNLTIC